MSGPLDALMGAVKEAPRVHQRELWYPARVTGKDGTRLYVRRYGATRSDEIEGPLPTRAGVAGVVRVGDEVIVDWRYGSPVIDLPIERAALSGLNVLGEDLRTEETTSVSTPVKLLEVDVSIPRDLPFNVQFKVRVEVVGSAGASNKQCFIVFNETIGSTITLGTGDGLFWIPTRVSSMAPLLIEPNSGDVGRNLLYETSEPVAVDFLNELGEVNHVAVWAQTNDASQSNDIVRAADLVVGL